MQPTRQGSFRLFQIAGISVYLHWSWLLVAMYEISTRVRYYASPVWNVIEYLALFALVLMHEFGHALACRQVGGEANQIVLWPLGGVAYVNPPPRPGAMLWSIAAGPLVNVVLIPVFFVLQRIGLAADWPASEPDAFACLVIVAWANQWLLIFNLLPIYPTDGGQILRSLLWFGLGRARSLLIATIVGFIGVAGFAVFVFTRGGRSDIVWPLLITLYLGSNCWRGFQQARALQRLEALPRHTGFACPACHAEPPQAELWLCRQCRQPFDMFASGAVCPHCGTSHENATCPHCGEQSPFSAWTKNGA